MTEIKGNFMAATIDPRKVEDIIRECAAECIMPRFRNLQSHEINTKSGPNDLVTIADKESELYLERELTKLYSGTVLIGEEGISAGLKTTAVLQDHNAVVWVADPVDGTWNFAHGDEHFAVMLACVAGGEVIHGWIYDVPAGRMMTASKGAGAFIDGVRLSVSNTEHIAHANGFAGRKYFTNAMKPHIDALKQQAASLTSLNCAGHEYLNLAAGKADFAVYSRIRPWDHLAGTLAVKEAGGTVMNWDGTPYKPSDEFGGIIVASHPALYHELHTSVGAKLAAAFKSEFRKGM
ncbi:MAG TPA: inositol monophosphatase [Alphaproteobacteria bacterium]